MGGMKGMGFRVWINCGEVDKRGWMGGMGRK